MKPTRRFSYGYGRVEDLAGMAVVLAIFISALVAGYEAIHRLFHPEQVTHLGAVALASILDFSVMRVLPYSVSALAGKLAAQRSWQTANTHARRLGQPCCPGWCKWRRAWLSQS